MIAYRFLPALILSVTPLFGATAPATNDLISETIRNSNAFAAAMLKYEAKRAPDNLVVCPPAVRQCLSVAAFLAQGETRDALAKAARLPSGQRQLEAEGLAQAHLLNFGYTSFEKTELFLDAETLKLKPGYESLLRRYWGAGLKSVSFADPESALNWMNSDSEGTGRPEDGTPLKVPFSAADLTSARERKTGALLVSRSHFKRLWEHPFRPDATRIESFKSAAGKPVEVAMMHLVKVLPCAKIKGGKVVRLTINEWQSTLSTLFILPDEGVPANSADLLAACVTPDTLIGPLTKHHATVALPRFRISHRSDPEGFARDNGAGSAFDAMKGDFSASLESAKPGWKPAFGAIRQEAFFQVDEHGAEAGSVTGMSIISTFGAEKQKKYPEMTLRFDRPFLFVLERDGLILFSGVCGNPPAITARERDLIALNAIATTIGAFAKSRFAEPGEKNLTVGDIRNLLTLPDGRPVLISWKEGEEKISADSTVPADLSKVLPPELTYTLRLKEAPDGEPGVERDLPRRPSAGTSE